MRISVKVHPKAKQAKLIEKEPGSFEIWVREAPDKGRANTAVIEALSAHLNLPKSRMSVVSGLASRSKIIEVG